MNVVGTWFVGSGGGGGASAAAVAAAAAVAMRSGSPVLIRVYQSCPHGRLESTAVDLVNHVAVFRGSVDNVGEYITSDGSAIWMEFRNTLDATLPDSNLM